jgi:hypothetical protein
VKSEGEKALPKSLFSIIINSSCIYHFLQQECRNPTFTFTFTFVDRAVTQKVEHIFVGSYQSTGGAGLNRRWGRGVVACCGGDHGILGKPGG